MIFRFEHSEYLYALIAIPLLISLFILMWYARKGAIQKFGDTNLMQRLMPQMARYKHAVKFALLMFAMVLFIIGWANPQWATKRENVKRKSVDVFIALDISQSMMARDIRPDRLERAKQFALKLIDGLKGERMGIIIFAGNAYLQMPLTTDYAAAQLFVKSANTRMAPSQGTAIGDAIDLAERAFEPDNKHHKAIIVITDGENHDDEAVSRANEANDNGLLIFTVGIGTVEGDFIPTIVAGRNDFKRDETGNPVRSSLNEDMLRQLATAGGGAYYRLTEGDKVISALRESIDQMEKREFEQRSFSDFESHFQIFLGIGLLILLIEFLISYRKNRWLAGKDMFG